LAERDLALILTALLAGLRADELRQADVGDVRTTDDGAAVIHVKGKGGKERSVPIEAELLSVIEAYLTSRAVRFPAGAKSKAPKGNSLTRWPARSPLFVGRDGELITTGEQCSLESSGPSNVPAPTRSQSPARSSGLRHPYAAELDSSDVSVYTLMKLLGHESMTTSQRHVAAAGTAPIVPQRKTRSMSSSGHIVDLINKVTTVAVEVTKTVRRRTVFSSAQPIP